MLTEAGVEARRIGPVWLYVDSTDRPRQLMVHVQPARPVERGDIAMELMQLSLDDPNARRQAQAYRLLAHGMQRVYADDSTTWAQRVQSLRSASRAFASLGIERLRLWADFYAAHLVLHRLDDVVTSLELSAEIGSAAQRAGREDIALANDVLVAEALLRGADKAAGARQDDWFERAHAALEALAERAGALGYAAEQGRALYRDGVAWERQGELARALERYEQALAVTGRSADTALLNRIRATAAAAYEAQGSTSGAIGLLEDIADDLPVAASANADRAQTQYEKGRLLNASYRYAEAAETLAQALRLQQDDPAVSQWGRTGLALGQALYALGDLREARRVLRESLPRAAPVESAALVQAYDALAHIARFEGRYDEMAAWRERQAAQPGRSLAAQAFAEGMDSVARDGSGAAVARRNFERARDLAAAGGETLLQNRAELHHCLHALRAGEGCDGARARAARDVLLQSGLPAIAADGRLLHAQILRAFGSTRESAGEVMALLTDLRFYRERLPGVLGAWDWAHSADVYREHLALALQRAASNGADVLLALEQVRALEQALPDGSVNDALRNRIAALEALSGSSPDAPGVAAEIRVQRDRFADSNPVPDRAFLDSMLSQLGRRETVLSWHLADREAYLLVAGRGGVRLHPLGPAAPLRARLDELGAVLASAYSDVPAGLLERLGAELLGPAASTLAQRVYVLAGGAMNGVPVDALRLDGQFLAERSDVVRLASLATVPRRRAVVPDDFGNAVFLAGNPRSERDLFQYEVSRSEEIEAVRDRFVGSGLHIVQGVALDRDEFDDDRFAAAALLHLAMAGRIDLLEPERSRLQIAGASADGFLSAPDLRAFDLSAALAVLSNTVVEGRARNEFSGRIGLVSDLHLAGAGAVMASLWPAGDRQNAELMADFYDRLERTGDVVEAFAEARRARIDRENPTNLRRWAGFQLFIR